MAASEVHALLEEHGVAYEVHVHPRAVDANRLAEAEDVTGWDVAKPVLLDIAGQLAMVVVAAPVHVDLERAGDVLGHSEVRLATEDEFASTFPDCEPGAEPPFGNLWGVPVFLDETLRARHTMVCRDGSHTTTIRLAVADYVRVVGPEIVDVATSPG
jgi:Ala-tRNA(Pro) deacylase